MHLAMREPMYVLCAHRVQQSSADSRDVLHGPPDYIAQVESTGRLKRVPA